MTKPRRITPDDKAAVDRVMASVVGGMIVVHVEVTLPTDLGGRTISKTVESPADEYIVGFGKGPEAALDYAVHQIKEELRARTPELPPDPVV